MECEIGTNSANQHVCPKDRVCSRCNGKRCLLTLPKLHTYCTKCYGMFSNPECRTDHIENGICTTATTCELCGMWLPNKKSHMCNDVYCTFCKKSHTPERGCFIMPSVKDSERKTWRYVFYDLETYQQEPLPGTNKRPHVVNYVVAMSSCSNCHEQACESCRKVHHFSGLNGNNAMYNFCFWATSHPLNHHSVFIAHNAKSFDSQFVLDYLVSGGNTPELVMQGGKILNIRVQSTDVSFIDSLSFITMPLSDFTRTFDIPDIEKGLFPHHGRRLIRWHEEHKSERFVFDEELSRYCEADVALLKEGCMKFRTSFLSATAGDPFRQITIASACMEVFRKNFLTANTIGMHSIFEHLILILLHTSIHPHTHTHTHTQTH